MSLIITVESLDWLEQYWQEHSTELVWEPLFILPPWLRVWHRHFAPTTTPAILAAKRDGNVTGIAPLLIDGDSARIIGSPNVCDYEDLVIAEGEEAEFSSTLMGCLKDRHIKLLDFGVVRPDSRIVSGLAPALRAAGAAITLEPDEVSLEKDLPGTWEDYLQSLDAKQRHEIKRKLRRLEEAGKTGYSIVTEPASVPDFMDMFVKMFVESRTDKAAFLTSQMNGYFRDLAQTMAEAGLLRSGVLDIDGRPVAAVMAFDYNGTVYLYNSGYDADQAQLSVGVISKVLLIKYSIERGRKKFDFLKGGERYKYHLGGTEVALQKCRITMNG